MMFMQCFTVRFWLDYSNIDWSYYLIIFYVLILAVFLLIIDFFYCAFAINNSRHTFSFTWPIHLLQYSCLLLMTILFQPVLGKYQYININIRVIFEYVIMCFIRCCIVILIFNNAKSTDSRIKFNST